MVNSCFKYRKEYLNITFYDSAFTTLLLVRFETPIAEELECQVPTLPINFVILSFLFLFLLLAPFC